MCPSWNNYLHTLPHKGLFCNTYRFRRNLNQFRAQWSGYASVIPNLCFADNSNPFLQTIDKAIKGAKAWLLPSQNPNSKLDFFSSFVVFLYIDYCKIQLNAPNYAWNKRKHDTAQHSYVRHLGNALDKRDWRWHLTSAFSQRLRKYTFTAVHTKTHKRRFQIYPLWRAFSNLCVYSERFNRLRVDGRPKRIKKFAFTSVCVYNRLRVNGAWVYAAPWCYESKSSLAGVRWRPLNEPSAEHDDFCRCLYWSVSICVS